MFVHLIVEIIHSLKLVDYHHVHGITLTYLLILFFVIEGIKLESYARGKGLSGPPSRSLQWSSHGIQQYINQPAIFLLQLSRVYGYTSTLLHILTNIVISQPILMRFSIRFFV